MFDKAYSPAKARTLNNGYYPLFQRIKVLKKKKKASKDVEMMERAGLAVPDSMKEKNQKDYSLGVIVAKGSDADVALHEGDIVEFGSYAGYLPFEQDGVPDDSYEFRIINDVDCTQIKLSSFKEYNDRFPEVK